MEQKPEHVESPDSSEITSDTTERQTPEIVNEFHSKFMTIQAQTESVLHELGLKSEALFPNGNEQETHKPSPRSDTEVASDIATLSKEVSDLKSKGMDIPVSVLVRKSELEQEAGVRGLLQKAEKIEIDPLYEESKVLDRQIEKLNEILLSPKVKHLLLRNKNYKKLNELKEQSASLWADIKTAAITKDVIRNLNYIRRASEDSFVEQSPREASAIRDSYMRLSREIESAIRSDRFPDLSESDSDVIRQLISHIGASKLTEAGSEILSRTQYNSREEYLTLGSTYATFSYSFLPTNQSSSYEPDGLVRIEGHTLPRIPEWKHMVSSDSAQKIFQPYINEVDDAVYQLVLDKALDDSYGTEIDALKYYPTPESIRTLVLIAAGEPYGHSLVHANGVLTELAKRDDWAKILNDCIEQYPDMEPVKGTLATWDFTQQNYEPSIRAQAEQIALMVYNDQSLPEKYRIRARRALPTETLLSITAENVSIDEKNTNEILNLLSFITEISSIDELETIPHDEIILDSAARTIDQLLRTQLLSIPIGSKADESNSSAKIEIAVRDIARLSDAIYQHKNDDDIVRYLTSHEVIGINSVDNIALALRIIDEGRFLLDENNRDVRAYITEHASDFIFDRSDFIFIEKIVNLFGKDASYILSLYRDSLKQGAITHEGKESFIEDVQTFIDTHTLFTPQRSKQVDIVTESAVGSALEDLIRDPRERDRIYLDIACFSSRLETTKIDLILNAVRNHGTSQEIEGMLTYLRWLPDQSLSLNDSLSSLEKKYTDSFDTFAKGFERVFPSADSIAHRQNEIVALHGHLKGITDSLGLPTRPVKINGLTVGLPEEFIHSFTLLRREDTSKQLFPELSKYLTTKLISTSTAYTVEDVLLSQIGDTEDRTGRRRGNYDSETLIEALEDNIDASLSTWKNAISYQHEKPDSPLFIIANERTGPADLAAEYLPTQFADKWDIAQKVDYEGLFSWFKENEALVSELYERKLQGEDVMNEIPQEVKQFLDLEAHTLIPIYRLKVPSSLNGATAEPEGIDTVINFLKLTSILGGRNLFMDESTRNAPRSIECMYNVLNRRQDDLHGVRVRLFGKINGTVGTDGTNLQEVARDNAGIEIAFIDPWSSKRKPVNDDSEGFVPEIEGHGIVEVVVPSYTAVSPYGVETIQDFWKQMIANEVSTRFDSYISTGGERVVKEDSKRLTETETVFTQEELRDMAFNHSYKALAIDLDGVVGSHGKYDPDVVEKLKLLAARGIDVVVATSRSTVDNSSNYDGSITSFRESLGELTEDERKHMYLATEDGAEIKQIDSDELISGRPMRDEDAVSFETMLSEKFPTIHAYRETSSLVLRDFIQSEKDMIMTELQSAIAEHGLPLTVSSASKHSIHVRTLGASKRNVLDFLEGKGINMNQVAKIGDAPKGNDRAMLIGVGSFNVGKTNEGNAYTLHMQEHGWGTAETNALLEQLRFSA